MLQLINMELMKPKLILLFKVIQVFEFLQNISKLLKCLGESLVIKDSQLTHSQLLDTSKNPPKFITHLQPYIEANEGNFIHLQCQLEPTTDGSLAVEWYHNNVQLQAGHRFRTLNDFGFVNLDILYVYPEV